jgi:hypothetical protein
MYTDDTRPQLEKRLAKLVERRQTLVEQFERFKATQHLLDADEAIIQHSTLQTRLFRLDDAIERAELNLDS